MTNKASISLHLCNYFLMMFVVLAFSTTAFLRNNTWNDPLRLMEDVLSKSPRKGRAYINVCSELVKHQRYEASIPVCSHAITLIPYDAHAYDNLGVAYFHLVRND
jgi:hypothetical protein